VVQQGSKPGSVGWIEPDLLPVELALRNHDLVPSAEDLGVLIAVAAREQS
jgi:hypothetical protein